MNANDKNGQESVIVYNRLCYNLHKGKRSASNGMNLPGGKSNNNYIYITNNNYDII